MSEILTVNKPLVKSWTFWVNFILAVLMLLLTGEGVIEEGALLNMDAGLQGALFAVINIIIRTFKTNTGIKGVM